MRKIVFLMLLLVLASGCVGQAYCGDMSLKEARSIAKDVCGDYLENNAVCNDVTGTWWIDLSLERENCSPACVVDVVTKEAEINWRCLGLIER